MKDNTIMLIFGVAVLGLLGFLAWRAMTEGGIAGKTTLTEFERDNEGRIKTIIDHQNGR